MRRFSRWYGAGPLHLLTLLGCLALAGYAAAQLLPSNFVGIPVWLVGAVIAHDLVLFPLYTLADRSALAVLRHRPPRLPAVPAVNYLRVPAVLSGILLLIWFPLIFRLPARFPHTTTLPLSPYLWHWLAVTGALFLLSATAYAVRLRGSRVRQKEEKQEKEEERQHADTRQVRQDPDATQTKSGAAPPSPRHPEANDRSSAMTTPSTIADRVNAMHQARAAGPSGGPADAFAREQAELAATPPAGVASVGTVLPDASLLDPLGAAVTLSSAAGDGTSVLVFYRGAWCPYCNIALSAYQQELLPELARRGIPLVAISPQRPDGSLTMRDKHGLAFAVLSDPGSALAASLGILTKPSPGARAAQLELGLDLTEANADGTVTLPMPAVVILGPGRTVRWIDVHPDYSTRTEPQQVIHALDDACNPDRKE